MGVWVRMAPRGLESDARVTRAAAARSVDTDDLYTLAQVGGAAIASAEVDDQAALELRSSPEDHRTDLVVALDEEA